VRSVRFDTCRGRLALALALFVALTALVAAPSGQASRVKSSKVVNRYFKMNVTFSQMRQWTYYAQNGNSSGAGCTMTWHANGHDDIKMTGKGGINLPVRGGKVVVGLYPTGIAMTGSWDRVGVRTLTRTGECGDNPATETDPDNGCGSKTITLQFATAEVNNRYIRLTWDSGKKPDFKPCPYFDGANDLAEGAAHLPGDRYLPMSIRFPNRLRDPKRVVATGTAKEAATETCGSLQGGSCPEGSAYDASASVESSAKITLVRAKTTR
jgi:hypothetical protein